MDVSDVSTTRRKVVCGAAITTALSLAGCLDTGTDDSVTQDTNAGDSDTESPGTDDSDTADSDTDESDTEGTDDRESESEELTDAEQLAALRSYLDENEITVEEITLDDDERIVTVEYVTEQTHEEALAAEIGTISGGGMQRLDAGWDIRRFEALMIQNDEPIATWYMERSWFEEFEAGERTADELSIEILDTLEFVE